MAGLMAEIGWEGDRQLFMAGHRHQLLSLLRYDPLSHAQTVFDYGSAEPPIKCNAAMIVSPDMPIKPTDSVRFCFFLNPRKQRFADAQSSLIRHYEKLFNFHLLASIVTQLAYRDERSYGRQTYRSLAIIECQHQSMRS